MNIVPFAFKGKPIRVIEIESEPWFVGKDVAQALGYSNPQDAVRRHCQRAQNVGGAGNAHPSDNVGGSRNVTPSDLDPQTKIIAEGDVYRLIIRSNRPEAEAFETLVMDEILPTIRKTGKYETTQLPVALDLNDPSQLRGLLGNYAERTEIAEAKVIELTPKAEAHDRLEICEGAMTPRPASKTLGYPERKLTQWMQLNSWAFRQSGKGPLQAYADKKKAGYLDHNLRHYTDPVTGEEKVSAQLVITPKGLARLAKVLPLIGGAA